MSTSSPPPGVLIRYKLFGMPVPEAYRKWVYHDITSSKWPREEALRRSWPIAVVYLTFAIMRRDPWSVAFLSLGTLLPFVVNLWRLSASSDRARKEALDRQSGKIAPQITKQTFYWMFGGLVLAGMIYALFEIF